MYNLIFKFIRVEASGGFKWIIWKLDCQWIFQQSTDAKHFATYKIKLIKWSSQFPDLIHEEICALNIQIDAG